MKIRVGIPRTLAYYTYYPLWQGFLEKLGVDVVLSRLTNQEILESGIREAVSDACIPIKLFHGHVLDLKDRVDYLFIPRLVSAGDGVTFCPKFLGLPDMIRFSIPNLPPIIDVRLSIKGLPGGLLRFLLSIAAALGIRNLFLQQKAALYAFRRQRRYRRLLQTGMLPVAALAHLAENKPMPEAASGLAKRSGDRLTVAILGYPYAIYDTFLSANLQQRLHSLGVAVVTPEQIPQRYIERRSRYMPQNFFWHYSNRVARAGLYLLEKRAVDGFIHITAFGCGPDAMVDKLLELETKKVRAPFLTLCIDEHTGEGGVQTRLEAFVDMLQAQQEKALGEAAE